MGLSPFRIASDFNSGPFFQKTSTQFVVSITAVAVNFIVFLSASFVVAYSTMKDSMVDPA
jgi:hypothetical protein